MAMGIAFANIFAPMCTLAEEAEVEQQQGLEENSFRYEDGAWIYQDYGVSMMTEDDDQAEEELIIPWIYEEGYWRNDRGEPIKAAIEKGIDVSYHNREIDWEKVQQTDVSYAIIRCGYGNDQENQDDSYWEYNADECTRLGIPFGTYIYSYALDVEEAKIAEAAGAVAVMALERVPSDIRKQGGVARMSDPKMIREIQEAVSIPVMAKVRIGH